MGKDSEHKTSTNKRYPRICGMDIPDQSYIARDIQVIFDKVSNELAIDFGSSNSFINFESLKYAPLTENNLSNNTPCLYPNDFYNTNLISNNDYGAITEEENYNRDWCRTKVIGSRDRGKTIFLTLCLEQIQEDIDRLKNELRNEFENISKDSINRHNQIAWLPPKPALTEYTANISSVPITWLDWMSAFDFKKPSLKYINPENYDEKSIKTWTDYLSQIFEAHQKKYYQNKKDENPKKTPKIKIWQTLFVYMQKGSSPVIDDFSRFLWSLFLFIHALLSQIYRCLASLLMPAFVCFYVNYLRHKMKKLRFSPRQHESGAVLYAYFLDSSSSRSVVCV